jgi:hypothetical protein
VWWQPGEELLVGAEQKVLVFDQDGGLLATLEGTHPSFGASLEVTPSEYVVDRVWVGEPANGRVWSFIGDAGTPNDGFPVSFGATLARSGVRILVGAPSDSLGAGAIYASHRGAVIRIDSDPGECSPGTCPVVNCVGGTCVGGVVCSYEGLGLCPDAGKQLDAGEDAGTTDAGTTDAGTTDAGTTDAGTTDAGTTDAGTTDAGTDAGTTDAGTTDAGAADAGTPDLPAAVQFATFGCSTGATGPLLVLALALRRRR